MALEGDAPADRAIEGPDEGDVIALPRVGGFTIGMRERPDSTGERIFRHHNWRDTRARLSPN